MYGPGIDQPILWSYFLWVGDYSYRSDEYYHRDALGSVIATSRHGAGRLARTHTYSPYGLPEESGVVAGGNPYLYTGREYDSETGLYYYRNRYYDPQRGRFLQPDPIGYQAGMNLYAYVDGNPITWADPLGLDKMFQGASHPAQNAGHFDVQGSGSVNASFATTVGMVGYAPVGVYGAGSLSTEGSLNSEVGLGLVAGKYGALDVSGAYNIGVGNDPQFELAFIFATQIPFTPATLEIDARVSLDTPGASVSWGGGRGTGAMGFIGLVKQVGTLDLEVPCFVSGEGC